VAGQFIEFTEHPQDPRKETRLWSVMSTQGDRHLGLVVWHSPWRRYVFQPLAHTVFDKGCLDRIGKFLEEQTLEQKKGWRRPQRLLSRGEG
jgi:hypothetical protein